MAAGYSQQCRPGFAEKKKRSGVDILVAGNSHQCNQKFTEKKKRSGVDLFLHFSVNNSYFFSMVFVRLSHTPSLLASVNAGPCPL